jgi:RNA polymerase sigma-70 factor (ECF subfamily)
MSQGELQTHLILQAVGGDRASLSELLLIHYDELKQFVSHRIPAELQSLLRDEDVLHQTFVRAARAITEYELRNERAFGSWLKTIAANLIKDAERRRRRERRANDLPGGRSKLASRSSRALAAVDGLAGSGSTPSRRIQLRENLLRLKKALANLPQDQRDVLERYYLRDESLDDIARCLHRSKDSVRGICYRARRNLRVLMGHSSLYFSG